uniref:Helicase Sen1 N-terminal domain-containing protein n=1 Tax=Salix viminalis TaxID=40686 RepID=A0A6N2LBK7_SALVM
MAKRELLLDRWRTIEEEEELHADDGDNPVIRRRLHLLKEQWFADTFKYLISLATEEHIWCGNFDLMAPLLETFYNYYKDDRLDSPLRLLWKRMSGEMQHCIQCVSQHHQAQEMYDKEYEMSSIGPLLEVLRSIDEERVTHHLREINDRLKKQEYDPLRDNVGVVSLMYEVLMFPVLLDDQSLLSEFELFIEAVDNMHELALSGHQQFPGVYALLFLNRRVRTVGRRLARSMEKLRGATDLEPLQPLLNKFIGFLETEILPSASKTSRPRAQLERLSIWLGITSLLEFLEPPAFEEGILERYPIFFDIVLNHISGDSAEFSHAVSCLKELFKMLGCKLWLRSTLSPSVMRNTLLGQCFHTRNEKIHKDIFDLFPPFLQAFP